MIIKELRCPTLHDWFTDFRRSARYVMDVLKHDIIELGGASRADADANILERVIKRHLAEGCARCQHFYGAIYK